jgi:hypothetical protein
MLISCSELTKILTYTNCAKEKKLLIRKEKNILYSEYQNWYRWWHLVIPNLLATRKKLIQSEIKKYFWLVREKILKICARKNYREIYFLKNANLFIIMTEKNISRVETEIKKNYAKWEEII